MLFSTLIPTLLHFALAGASVVLWFPAKICQQWVENFPVNSEEKVDILLPIKIQNEIQEQRRNDFDIKVGIWFYVSIMPVLGFVITPALLLYSLWLLLSSFDLGMGLIHFFQNIVES